MTVWCADSSPAINPTVNSFSCIPTGFLLACSVIVSSISTAQAAETENLPAINCPGPRLGPVLPHAPDRSGAPAVLFARYLDASKTDAGEASENVELFRADQHLTTERIIYDPNTQILTFPQAVSYEDQQVWIKSQKASYSFLSEEGQFSVVDYGLTGSRATGTAHR